MFPFRRHGPRQRVMGSVGVIGSLAGAFLAGQFMVWLGLFRPGVTPNGEIIEYWPGFLAGAVVGGAAAAIAARSAFAWLQE